MKRLVLLYLIFLLISANALTQNPTWAWVKSLHTPDDERATSVASDPATGAVYMAGEWMGLLDGFFPVPTTESTDFTATFGGVDGLVVKMDPDGNVLWAFKVGGPGDDRINDIHVDFKGQIYICGAIRNGISSFAGTGVPDATTEFFNSGNDKAFLAKFDPGGGLVWVRLAGGLDFSEGRGIATNQDAVFFTGFHMGDISFGVLPPYTSVNGADIFLTKYSLDGGVLWHVSAGSDRDDFGEVITCDGANVYLGGSFDGTTLGYKDRSGGVITATINSAVGQTDAFVASFTTDGFHQWSRIIASAAADDCQGIALDNEFVYLAGSIGREAVFPLYSANPVPNKGGLDAYLCAIGRIDGATKWVRTLTGNAAGDQVIRDLSMDPSGSLFMTGYFTSNVSTADTIIDSKGLEDIVLASYGRLGDERWIKTAGSLGPDMGSGICAITPGIVYVTGEYSDATAFDSKVLPADGKQNLFLASLNTNCMDALGGKLSASDTIVFEREFVTLVLAGYIGDISWQFSLPDQNNWTFLTADLRDSIEVFPSGTTDYRALVTSGNCASDSSNIVSVTVSNQIPGFAEAGDNVIICRGDSTRFMASGGESYKWEPLESLDRYDVPDPWAKPLFTTTYLVQVTNAAGETDSDSVTVFVRQRPQLDAGENVAVCLGESVQLTAVGSGDFRWAPQRFLNEPNIPDPVALVDTTTSFRVVLTDVNGCSNGAIVTVFVIPPPAVEAGPDQEITAQFEVKMDARLNSGDAGMWTLISGGGVFDDPGSPVSGVSRLEIGDNVFAWSVNNGICPEITDLVTIRVNDFIIPTVITPNGDGKNDMFEIEGLAQYRNTELTVLNRWGEVVFQNSPYQNDWDGMNQNGKLLPEDTYYTIIKLPNNEIRKSYLLIIR